MTVTTTFERRAFRNEAWVRFRPGSAGLPKRERVGALRGRVEPVEGQREGSRSAAAPAALIAGRRFSSWTRRGRHPCWSHQPSPAHQELPCVLESGSARYRAVLASPVYAAWDFGSSSIEPTGEPILVVAR